MQLKTFVNVVLPRDMKTDTKLEKMSEDDISKSTWVNRENEVSKYMWINRRKDLQTAQKAIQDHMDSQGKLPYYPLTKDDYYDINLDNEAKNNAKKEVKFVVKNSHNKLLKLEACLAGEILANNIIITNLNTAHHLGIDTSVDTGHYGIDTDDQIVQEDIHMVRSPKGLHARHAYYAYYYVPDVLVRKQSIAKYGKVVRPNI